MIWGAGGESLFALPGAVARANEAPLRLLAAPGALARAARGLRALGRVDRVVAHWLVPSALPVAFAVDAPLVGVAHGADVRLLLALPARAREAALRALFARGATLRFAAARLRDDLASALSPGLAAGLAAASTVQLPRLELPDVAARAHELRVEARSRGLAPLWVACARLVPEKRVERALDLAAREGAALVVVGDGPERARLVGHAARVGARASFTGALARPEALAWIAAADVLVHASEAEGAPTVVREARALGVRVRASRAGDVAAWAAADPGITLLD